MLTRDVMQLKKHGNIKTKPNQTKKNQFNRNSNPKYEILHIYSKFIIYI